MRKNKIFKYGKFFVEYRCERGSMLRFLREKIDDIDSATLAANKLKDLGYYDVTIRKNENG